MVASKYKEFYNDGKYKMDTNGVFCRLVSLTDNYKCKVKDINQEEFYKWAYDLYIKERDNTIRIMSLEEGLQRVIL